MTDKEFLAIVTERRLLGWLWADTPEQAIAAGTAAAEAGLTVLEVPMTMTGAGEVIAALARIPNILVGAGAILDLSLARAATRAGAMFLAASHTDRALLKYGRRRKRPTLLGAATPTEVYEAWRLGAAAVKVYPAGALGGPDYLLNLRRLYPDAPLLAAGAVVPDRAGAYLEAGALGVYLGGALFTVDLLAQGSRERAVADVRQALNKARERRPHA